MIGFRWWRLELSGADGHGNTEKRTRGVLLRLEKPWQGRRTASPALFVQKTYYITGFVSNVPQEIMNSIGAPR